MMFRVSISIENNRCKTDYDLRSCHGGVLCLFLPQRLQRAAPRDHLVEHGVDGLLLLGSRLKDREVLEVREE